MEHTQRKNGHIGQTRFLRIATAVLEFADLRGCSAVANKSGATILPLESALDEMDLEVLFGLPRQTIFSDPALTKRYNEARKAEILIPARIPQELIYNLH